MNPKDEIQEQLYLDEELSPQEENEFESQINEEHRERIEVDRKINKYLEEQFTPGKECPKELWNQVKKNILKDSQPAPPKRWVQRSLASAACLALCFFTYNLWMSIKMKQIPTYTGSELSQIDDTASFLHALPLNTQIPGKVSDVNIALNNLGYPFEIKKPSLLTFGHGISIAGMNLQLKELSDVSSIFFNCCGYPVVVFVSKNPDSLNSLFSKSTSPHKNIIQSRKQIGDAHLLALSKHATEEALQLFN